MGEGNPTVSESKQLKIKHNEGPVKGAAAIATIHTNPLADRKLTAEILKTIVLVVLFVLMGY